MPWNDQKRAKKGKIRTQKAKVWVTKTKKPQEQQNSCQSVDKELTNFFLGHTEKPCTATIGKAMGGMGLPRDDKAT